MELLTSGDKVNLCDRYIVVKFNGKRKVLSTSVLNGGYREDLTAVFNHDMSGKNADDCVLFADTYEQHLIEVAKKLGLSPIHTTGIGTTAQMKNYAISTMNYNDLFVTAIVTAGVETNAGRAGDSAKHFLNKEKPVTGTINIILNINADMSKGALTRALVTCTEAKTAALQELMVDSRYSTGIATGTGTDSTIITANSESSLYFEGAGKHTKLGELIGKTVIMAVKEALLKQNELNALKQHDLLRRLRRFGVTEDTVWGVFNVIKDNIKTTKAQFIEKLYELSKSDSIVPFGIMYIHLIDELNWNLLNQNEVKNAAIELIEHLAVKFNTTARITNDTNSYIRDFEYLLASIIKKQLNDNGEVK